MRILNSGAKFEKKWRHVSSIIDYLWFYICDALCEKVAIFLKLIFQCWLNNAKNMPSGDFVIIVVSCGQIPWLSLPAVSKSRST